MPLLAKQQDRKSTRLNSSHTVIYTLSLHDALPISLNNVRQYFSSPNMTFTINVMCSNSQLMDAAVGEATRSEEHTSELQSHSDLHSFPTRRSSDLVE